MAKSTPPVNDPKEIFRLAEDFRVCASALSHLHVNLRAAQAKLARPSRMGEYTHYEIDPSEFHSPYDVPQIVNAMFSAELFLKCLYVIEKGTEAPHTHDLKKLFDLLSHATQKSISDQWEELCNRSPTKELIATMAKNAIKHSSPPLDFSLVAQLKFGVRAFDEWRYKWQSKPTEWYLASLADVICIAILNDIRPDWSDVSQLNKASRHY